MIAINIVSAEDRQVLPFVRSNSYGFIPLKGGGRDWRKTAYELQGTPWNFLIDRSGRIIFEPAVRNLEEERTLELEIEALLDHGL